MYQITKKARSSHRTALSYVAYNTLTFFSYAEATVRALTPIPSISVNNMDKMVSFMAFPFDPLVASREPTIDSTKRVSNVNVTFLSKRS